MDANKPIKVRDIAQSFLQGNRNLSEMDFHRLFSEIEFDVECLTAIRDALIEGYGEDVSSLQSMVNEIARFEKDKTAPVEQACQDLLDSIFQQLDRLNVDCRRLVMESINNVVCLAGDF